MTPPRFARRVSVATALLLLLWGTSGRAAGASSSARGRITMSLSSPRSTTAPWPANSPLLSHGGFRGSAWWEARAEEAGLGVVEEGHPPATLYMLLRRKG